MAEEEGEEGHVEREEERAEGRKRGKEGGESRSPLPWASKGCPSSVA